MHENILNMAMIVLILLSMAYGAYAFVKRQIGEYMFLSSKFVFSDFGELIFYVFLDYPAIMILFACLGHYLILLFVIIFSLAVGLITNVLMG